MTESNLHHQIKQISTIRSLIQETSEEEARLLERLSTNRQVADQARDVDLAALDLKSKTLRLQASQERDCVLKDVEKRRTLEPIILKEKHEQRIIEINSEAEEISEKLESKLNEATWLAESLYEGGILKPREQAQHAHDALFKILEKLNSLCEEAPRTLSKLRQSVATQEKFDTATVEKSMEAYVSSAAKALEAIQSDPKARWFIGIRPVVILLLAAAPAVLAVGFSTNWELSTSIFVIPLIAMAVAFVALFLTYGAGRDSVRKKLVQFEQFVAIAKSAYTASEEAIETRRRDEELELTTRRDVDIKKAEDRFKPKLDEVDRLLHNDLEKESERFDAVALKLLSKLEQDGHDAHQKFNITQTQIEREEHEATEQIELTYKAASLSINADENDTNTKLISRWKRELHTFYTDVNEQQTACDLNHPSWDSDWATWEPRVEASELVPVGNFTVDLTTVGGQLPKSDDLCLQGDSVITLPLCATLSHDASVLISSTGKQRDQSIAFIQHAMLRVLTATPPGKVKFTLIDPVGLGQSFAGVLHLADYEESQLLDRAWTEPRHIESQLAKLTEHMETVIQKYLRNEFASIDAYNEQAGEIAEPYRFLVIADLPNNFSENAVKRLSSIITSGARCGVHVIIHRDTSVPLPSGIDADTLRRIPLRIVEQDDQFCIDEQELGDLPLLLDAPPDELSTTIIVKKVGTEAEKTHRVEVPFPVIAPSDDEVWSLSTIDKLTIPLGKRGATKLQNLTLGRGTAQHALIAGKTGSGKSTLLHVLITNLSLWYSPDEVEFYLVDFKKGVEFKTYATHHLPHARVVAVESDREFGISVLQKIDLELKHRGELFRDLGVQDISGYRRKSSKPMPRVLLIIDEFQEFFIDDDRISQEANLLLDRLVRQGRAFGIHAIMGSQTLDGTYTLGRSTMGQMAVRVALQCSEADSYIILNEDNAAARLLSRPGEAIYNDAAGRVEGNSPFQVVWLDDKEREKHLGHIATRDFDTHRNMVIYEGNQPVHLHENEAFQDATRTSKPLSFRGWVGGAMAIKEDTSVTFRTASASNLLIVGQQEETTVGMLASIMLSIDKQCHNSDASFVLLDGTSGDAHHATVMKDVVQCMDCNATVVGVRGVEESMSSLYDQLKHRLEHGAVDEPAIFLIINALHRFRELRRDEDDFGFSVGDETKPKTPSQVLAELIKEGPPLGIHVVIATDTLANLNRVFDRQGIREFDVRILLQMGGNDSTNLIDVPDATKLGMHRALLYSEETGTIEPFRPYALPNIEAIART